jgi:hypothetical protein
MLCSNEFAHNYVGEEVLREAQVLSQVGRIAHTGIDTILTGCFLMVWLLCWPFYRLYRNRFFHL